MEKQMSNHEFDATICDSTIRYETVRVVHASVHREVCSYAEQLRSALEEYGSHHYGCGTAEGPEGKCTCGLSNALAKNPNPSGLSNEDIGTSTPLPSGPVGLGPRSDLTRNLRWALDLVADFVPSNNYSLDDYRRAEAALEAHS